MSKVLRGDDLAKGGTEHGHQRALFAELNFWSPSVYEMTFAIPNGGGRGGHGAEGRLTAMIRGNQLKAEGVKPGVPDVMVAWPFRNARGLWAGLFVEMKRPADREKDRAAGRLGKAQEPWHDRLRDRGYFVEVCYTWQEALDAVKRYFDAVA